MKILAVTSGKGGVGKSTFSLNIARQLSLSGRKTLLVDFDIHNKGITSLFLSKIGEKVSGIQPTSITDLVLSSEDFSVNYKDDSLLSLGLIRITPDGMLLFIPASLPKQMIQWTRFHGENSQIISYFSSLFKSLAKLHNIECIVIDCYGGIDSMTVAAAGIADDTIIVNEPDLITFTGTILLYKYLLDQYRNSGRMRAHFLINRVPSRYTYTYLSQAYSQNLAEYSVDKQILAYFPYDKLIIETFGDYPFFSEILPKSLFTKKICLLIESLWGSDPLYARFSGLSKVWKKKIFERTTEYFFEEPDRIIRTFARAPFFLIVPSLLLFLLARGVGGTLDYRTILAVVYMSGGLIAVLVLFIGFFEPLQISKWLVREAQYHRRKRNLKASGSKSSRLAATTFEFGQALLPVVLGCTFLGTMVYYAEVQAVSYRIFSAHGQYKLLQIWPGEISGLHANTDYSGMMLHPGATLRPDTDLHGCKFVGASMPKVKFSHINLNGADFSESYLASSEFTNVDLRNSNFTNATIRSAKFEHGTAAGARFNRAFLVGASFDQIDLTNSNFFSSISLFGSNNDDLQKLGASFDPTVEDAGQMSTGDLADYLERDIVRADPKLGTKIATELTVLERKTNDSYDYHRGYFFLLQLESKTVLGIEDRPAVERWVNYLKSHHGSLAFWEWNFWDTTLNRKQLPKSRIARLDLIEQSAKGKIDPERFSESFRKLRP
jgi:flagellar biosynthesis protein FlhG